MKSQDQMDIEVAHAVVETLDAFNLRLDQYDPGTVFAGLATLVTSTMNQVARTDSPMRAFDMMAGQIDILFEENPGLREAVMLAQLRRMTERKKAPPFP